jgi:hypothetical protein
MTTNKQDTANQCKALAAPFDQNVVKFKPAVVSGNRAMAMAFVDARTIQDRLDEVLGVGGWQDDYEVLADGSVVCRLQVCLNGVWLTKVDVGSPSEQPDDGDKRKAAFSDALKRAAVKFGVGRYLYRLPAQWVDYDPKKRQFLKTPTLPAFALPAGAKETMGKPVRSGTRAVLSSRPASGVELKDRLQSFDEKLTKEGLCQRGDLLRHVIEAGRKAGHAEDLTDWADGAIDLAVDEGKKFAALVREQRGERKVVA